MHRLFIPQEQIPNITGSDVHYVKDVLRLRVGDEIELLDGKGTSYKTKIKSFNKEKIECEVTSQVKEKNEKSIKITLAQAIPKTSKMDFIIQKCTELGADKIIPMTTERTIVKETRKLSRWRKIAKESAEQCGRVTIPEITEPLKFEEIIKHKKDYALALIPWELERDQSLKSMLEKFRVGRPDYIGVSPAQAALRVPTTRILILIGPEGGFSQKEIDRAKNAGLISVSLGKQILRSETAGMAILAMLNFYFTKS